MKQNHPMTKSTLIDAPLMRMRLTRAVKATEAPAVSKWKKSVNKSKETYNLIFPKFRYAIFLPKRLTDKRLNEKQIVKSFLFLQNLVLQK